MDVLSITTQYRENLCKYVKAYLDDKSYIWVRNLLSDINKKIIVVDNDYIAAKSLLMYRNIIPFFEKQCTELTASGILYTLYSCAIQLDIRRLGDEVETYDQFTEGIDMDDWNLVTPQTFNDFDLRTVCCMINNKFNEEKSEVWGGGIMSIQAVDSL